MTIFAGENETSNIYLWGPDYTNIQGPCDVGFHIPTQWEMESLVNIVGSNPDDYYDYLHFPKCYYLRRNTGAIDSNYWTVRLWTCTMTEKTSAYCFYINENDIVAVALDKPSNWFNIRAFKDLPVEPDANWNELVSNKIYYNSDLWLISITDGTSWITIQDKNVWATVVYNNWDTITNDNAGYYFQFGNNYWFQYSWATDFYTSTQNVSWYGPWNYYSNSNWVKVNSNNWFSSDNNDIWGWESWIIQIEISEVYRWTELIYPPRESICIIMKADYNGDLTVPLAWYWFDYQQIWCEYSWNIRYDKWPYVTYSWTWWATSFLTLASWLTPLSEHEIEIEPVNKTYWWARAFGFGNGTLLIYQYLVEIVRDSSYMWYWYSETDTWNNFRYLQYANCPITKAPDEYLPDTVTTIWRNFRASQYASTSISSTPKEVMPTNANINMNGFRSWQYANCNSLRTVTWVNNATLPYEYVTYRSSQFRDCRDLTITMLSDIWTAISNRWANDSNVLAVYVPNEYLQNYINTTKDPRASISDSKFIGY